MPEVDDIALEDDELLQQKAYQQRVVKQRQNVVMRAAKLTDDAVRSVASGVTFGMADEFAALMDSMIGNRSFTEELATQRARDNMIDPGLRLGGEVVGGVLTGIATAGIAAPAVAGMSRIANFAARGAVEGAISGFGHAEGDIVERGAAAGTGAVVGGAVGAIAPIAMDKVVGAFQRVLGHRTTTRAQRKAILLVAKALQRDEITPDRAMAKLKQLGPSAVVADLPGENIMGTARAVSTAAGPARTIAQRAITTRQTTAADRVRGAIGASLSDKDAHTVGAALIVSRAKAAKPLYEEACQAGIVQTDDIVEIVKKSADIRAAIKQARRIPEYVDLPDNHIILLDKAYKNIGGKYAAAVRAGDGEAARDLNGLRVQLRNAIVKAVPVYGRALKTFSSESDLFDALELGRRLIKEDADVLTDAVKNMTAAEKEHFTIGVARAIRERLDASGDTASVARRIFGNQAIRDRIKLAFPDSTSYHEFERTMLREAVFARTASKVLGGSPTEPRRAELADFMAELGFGARADPSGIFFAASRMLRSLRKIPSREIGEAMFGKQSMTAIQQVGQEQARRAAVTPLAGGLIGGAVQPQIGRE